jgi:hypothetical protein
MVGLYVDLYIVTYSTLSVGFEYGSGILSRLLVDHQSSGGRIKPERACNPVRFELAPTGHRFWRSTPVLFCSLQHPNS